VRSGGERKRDLDLTLEKRAQIKPMGRGQMARNR
jgi:hypothetical protein